MAGQKKTKRVRRARSDFPKKIAEYSRRVAAVMVAKSMTTAHYVFDGAVGKSMILVTLDPKVTEAILVVLHAMENQGREVVRADEIPDAIDLDGAPMPGVKGGLAGLILDGVTRRD
jgi:hypothetical protein